MSVYVCVCVCVCLPVHLLKVLGLLVSSGKRTVDSAGTVGTWAGFRVSSGVRVPFGAWPVPGSCSPSKNGRWRGRQPRERCGTVGPRIKNPLSSGMLWALGCGRPASPVQWECSFQPSALGHGSTGPWQT